MNILLFSDFHNSVTPEALQKALSLVEMPDIAFTLGDISERDLRLIQDLLPDVPVYGVLGNHDPADTLTRAGIPNIHGQTFRFQGISFAGFEGSVRYKQGPYPMFSQKESRKACKKLPAADVLISHDRAFSGKFRNLFREVSNDPHEGLFGISEYLHRHSPFLHVHGHIHENKRYLNRDKDTICVYGVTALTLNDKKIVSHLPLTINLKMAGGATNGKDEEAEQ